MARDDRSPAKPLSPAPQADADTAAFVARLEAIRARRLRSETDPTPWERERFRRNPTALRQAIRLRTDASMKTYLGLVEAEIKKQARAMLAAGPAVFAALSREMSAQVRPVSYTRGTLTLAVPDNAVKFRVDRELRAGGEAAIIAALPVPVQKVRLAVRPGVDPPEADRMRPTTAEAEREKWEEVDSGGPGSPIGISFRCPACDAEFTATPDARPSPTIPANSPRRFLRLSCPHCNARNVFRLS